MEKEIGCYGYSDNGANDYIECVKKSWTYNSLNEEDKEKIMKELEEIAVNISHLTYDRQWDLLQGLYSTFMYCIRIHNGKIEGKEKPETLYNIKIVKDLDGTIKIEY